MNKKTVPRYPWENLGPVSLLLTCDVCKEEVKPGNEGCMTVETVLCAVCLKKAVESLKERA